MPRETNKYKLAERQDVRAPYLFDDEEMPVCLPVLEAIRQRKYEHTGQRLIEDEALAFRLVELLCLGWGVKKISREMCISAHTVRAAKQLLRLQGKLAPYKERVRQLFEEIIEVGALKYLEGLEKGTVQSGQIPVGVGIFSDKRALLLGEPTTISAVAAADDQVTVEKLNAMLESLPVAKGVTVDSKSTDSTIKPLKKGINGGKDDTLDATTPPPSPDNRTGKGASAAAGGEPQTGTPGPGGDAQQGGGGGQTGGTGPRPNPLG